MDYVFSIAFAGFFALIYSLFTSVIASRTRRPIYRKIMWGYLTTLLIAAVVITVLQLPSEWLAFGAALSSAFGVFAELGIAVKLGHLTMTDGHYSGGWNKASASNSTRGDFSNDWFWRDNQNRINHRDWY
ncbi:hypothetical protein [Burkholderia metallica]|uniref:hypothetical protein n=1 Tax=Burkholderia metallica TaxID=488729 RepID=UPI00158E91AE|nr:hypothetical protein [Burkholderia metallica]